MRHIATCVRGLLGWTWVAAALLTILVGYSLVGASAQERPQTARQGSSYQTAETQALQADDAANPAMLWVEQGASLWSTPAKSGGVACATCHGAAAVSMKGVAARYPQVDPTSGRLMNVEARIDDCRMSRQGAPPLAEESNEKLALTAFVTFQSRGMPRKVVIDGLARPFFEAGRTFFQTRQGQLDLACSQCHDGLEGRRLRGDTISQGQTHGWPAYRLEWQALGSLQRRLRACSLGVRAEVLPFGAPEYLALELYLAWRGEGLVLESPGVRR